MPPSPVKLLIDASLLPSLHHDHVFLSFATGEDRETLRPLAKDERLWEFTKTLLINDSYDTQFDAYFDTALKLAEEGGQAFVIRSVQDQSVLGMTRIMNVVPLDKRAEIGHTWYIPAVWGQVHNKECKLILLQCLFEKLGFCRVEFRVAHQNIRSQKAVEKIGGLKEGVLRKYTIRNDGSWRDTVVFSILDDEWPEKKLRLRQLIAAHNIL
jgi:RimJ/RimL family protein N-acetyltransferase